MCDFAIHGHLEQGLFTCQISLIMAHFLAEVGVGERRALISLCMGKQLSQPIWLTGTLYSVNPLGYSEGIKEAPPPQTRIDPAG